MGQLCVICWDPHFPTYFLFIMNINAQRTVPFRLSLRFIVAMLVIYSKCFITKDHNRKILKCLITRNIKFSFELEYDNEISFLDISITTGENKLQTSLFCRNTFSRVYLSFNSHLPNTYKGC